MANCINYNCDTELGAQLLNDCDAIVLGGTNGAVFLACDHQLTNPSSASQINAEVAAGRAWIYKNVGADIPQASPITIEKKFGCDTPRVINYDRTVNYSDYNVNDTNRQYYDNLFSGAAFGGMIINECSSGKVTWINSAISFSGDRTLPGQNKDPQIFEGKGSWRSLDMPSIWAAPVAIF